MIKSFSRWLLLSLALLMASCTSSEESKGTVLLWHSWPETQSAGLSQLIDAYETIQPDVEVIVSTFPSDDELLARFKNDAQLGLGPDLLIGPSDWLPELAQAGLLQNLNERAEALDTSHYLSTAVDTLRYRDGLYGLPLALNLVALYYNPTLVEAPPPQNLETLLRQTMEGGPKVALNIGFDRAFWGVRAFGGQLFNSDGPEPGRLVLDQGGFANWLGWLKQAQDSPNMILDSDDAALAQLFKEEAVAYYVGTPEVLPDLQETLGDAKVNVAPLPGGPNGPSGPFLRSEGLMFNAWSSAPQAERAIRLAQFLTDVAQQTRLARQPAPLVPANSRVRVNPQVYPAMAGFLAQSKTAVPVPHLPQMETLFQHGNEAYIQALSGTAEPSQVASELTQRVNTAHGFDPIEVLTRTRCPTEFQGTLSLWHPWVEPEAVVLAQIVRRFADLCPNIQLELAAYPDDLVARYRTAARQGQGPDLLLAPNEVIIPLAEVEVISNLTEQVEPEVLQQYVLAAQQTLQYQEKLYGLPVSMRLMALYYKADQVTDPPRVIDDLLTQATPEQQVALPATFREAFWGLAAFGGVSANPDTATIFLNETGFMAWLEWLKQGQSQPGIYLSQSREALLTAFVEGQAIYLAGDSTWLRELQEHLGRDQLRVVPLPAGPVSEAAPLLTTEGIMLNPAAGEVEQRMALEFAKYLTGVESQTMLQQRAYKLPANINVNVDRTIYPAMAGFLEQAQTASAQVNHPDLEVIWAAGDAMYQAVLNEDTDPEEVVSEFFEQVSDGNLIVAQTRE
jgi:maltose-binding protein MalE